MRTGARVVIMAMVLGCAGGARAADMPAKAPVLAPPVAAQWTGVYVGAFVGGLWGDKDWREIVGPVPGGIIHPRYSGVIGGAQLGVNYQINQWVLGVEADWGWTNAEGSTGCISNAAISCGVELRSVATVSGRVGYAFDRVLLYVKGGGAWVREDYPVAPGRPFAITLANTRDGWLMGGGLEYGFGPNWSAKAEYNYLDLGTDRLNFAGAIEDITQRAHVAKLGLNYRFAGWR